MRTRLNGWPLPPRYGGHARLLLATPAGAAGGEDGEEEAEEEDFRPLDAADTEDESFLAALSMCVSEPHVTSEL